MERHSYNPPAYLSWLQDEPHRIYANDVFREIRDYHKHIVATLKEDEILVIHAILADGDRIDVREFSYFQPSFIIIHGLDEEGNNATAMVSHTTVQIKFQVVKSDSNLTQIERPPIGFHAPDKETTED